MGYSLTERDTADLFEIFMEEKTMEKKTQNQQQTLGPVGGDQYMIIAAFAGTGKTTLAKLYPQVVIDFVCMPYKYLLEETDEYSEASKANPDYILQNDWPCNYVQAIKETLSDNKILLIPTDFFVLSQLAEEGIQYTLCYPQRNAKEVYQKRYIDRSNTKEFLDIFICHWDKYIDSLENDKYGHHIVLSPHQFLSDVINVNELLKGGYK